MQARVCVQTYDNGDVQGFLYLDDDTGETLVTTSPRYAAGSAEAREFTINGTKGSISATARVNVTSQIASFDVNFVQSGVQTTLQFSRSLEVSSAPCIS